jgi:hypothetical protein
MTMKTLETKIAEAGMWAVQWTTSGVVLVAGLLEATVPAEDLQARLGLFREVDPGILQQTGWMGFCLALAMILPSMTRVLRALAPAAAGVCAVSALLGAAYPALGFGLGLGIDTADLGLAAAAATVALGRTLALPIHRLDEEGRVVRERPQSVREFLFGGAAGNQG